MRTILIFCFLILSQYASAQKISDAYFIERDYYWKVIFKNYSEKSLNITEKKILKRLDMLIKKGGKNEALIFEHLLKAYQKKTDKNLNYANTLYFLEKKTQSSSDFVIWNEKDTLYCKPKDVSASSIKNLSSVKIDNFNSTENKQKSYMASVMSLIAKTEEANLEKAFEDKTKNKDGTIRIVLDGSTFTLYTFKKMEGEYLVKKYTVSNPRFIEN